MLLLRSKQPQELEEGDPALAGVQALEVASASSLESREELAATVYHAMRQILGEGPDSAGGGKRVFSLAALSLTMGCPAPRLDPSGAMFPTPVSFCHAGVQEPTLILVLTYLLQLFAATRRAATAPGASSDRLSGGTHSLLQPELQELAGRLLLPCKDAPPLPSESGASSFREADLQVRGERGDR